MQLDSTHKSIADAWLANPSISLIDLITRHIPEAKPHLGGCSRRFKTIMARPEVEQYVEQQIAKLQQQIDIDQHKAAQFLADTVNANIVDFLHTREGGFTIKDLGDVDRRLTAQIKKVKIKEHTHTAKNGSETVTVVTEFELNDKMAAIDRLAKLMKWWEESGKDKTLLGVIVLPEGKTKDEQWQSYVQIPEGGELLPAHS